jgi:hypothetical protein
VSVAARPFIVLSSLGAPVLLIGGWTVAAAHQHAGFDAITGTISALAGLGADDRYIMTIALYGVGVCHVLTALGLRPARLVGRRILGAGGLFSLGVASLPLPAVGTSSAHLVAAAGAFGCLTAWPFFAYQREPGTPLALRPSVSVAAGIVLVVLLGWLGVELGARTHVGLAERTAAAAQALWPLVVSVTCVVLGSATRRR